MIEYKRKIYCAYWVIEEYNDAWRNQWLPIRDTYSTYEKAQKDFCKFKWEFPMSKLRIVKIEKVALIKQTQIHVN